MRAGTLIVDIAANVARLQQDMTQAKGIVSGAMNDITRSVNVAKTALGALGVGLSVGAITSLAFSINKATAALDDMSEKTGTAVENLSRFQTVAKIGGHDMGLVESSLVKLTKGLKGTEEETKNATSALNFLGIQAKTATGQLRDPGEMMREVALKLGEFKDGAGKTALALDLFGKSGAQLLPFLKDMAEEGAVNARVTAQQAAEAEKLEKNLNRLKIAGEDAKREFINGITPAMVDFTNKMLDAQKVAGNLATALLLVATNGKSLADIDADIAKHEGAIKNRPAALKVLGAGMSLGPLGPAMAIAGAGPFADAADQTQLSLLYRQRDFYKLQQRRAANEVVDPLAFDKPAVPYTGVKDKPDKSKGDGEQMLLALQKQLSAAAGEASVFDATMRALTEGTKKFSIETQAAALAMAGEIDMLKRLEEQLKAEGAAVEANLAAVEKWGEGKAAFLATGAQALQQVEFETSLIGLNSAEREKAVAFRELELAAQRAQIGQSAEEIAKIDETTEALKRSLGAALDAKAAKSKAHEASAASAQEWKQSYDRMSQDIERALTDSLMRGGKSAAEYLEDLFRTLVLSPILRPIAQGISGMVQSTLGLGGGGGGGGFGMPSFGGGGFFDANSVIGSSIANIGGGTMLAGGGAGTALAGEAAALGIAQIGGTGAGALGAIGTAMPYVGAAMFAAQALGLFDEGGGPKASDIGITGVAGRHIGFSQNNVTDSAWGQQYAAQFEQQFGQLGPKGQAFMMQNIGASWQASGPDSAQNMVSQHIAPLMAQAAALDQQQADEAEQTAREALAVQQEQLKAQQALLARQPQLEAALGNAVRDLPQALGISSLEAARMSLAISEDVAPLDRFAAARGYVTEGYGRAMGGDLSAVQSFPELLQSALGIGRDVFASGSQFASLKSEGSRMLDELVARQLGVQAEITASVPMTIKEAAADQIGELRRGFKSMVDELRATKDELSRLGSLIAA